MASTFTANFNIELVEFDKQTYNTQINNNFTVIDALLAKTIALNGFTGIWTNSTIFTVGQQTVDPDTGEVFQVAVAHTSAASGTTFLQDRTANPTYWTDVTASAAGAVASAAAAALSATSAATSATSATASAVITTANAVSTAADVVSTAADVVSTAASATAASASAATINIDTAVANKRGTIIVQNAADDGFERLPQGTAGQYIESAGADALPVFVNFADSDQIVLAAQVFS